MTKFSVTRYVQMSLEAEVEADSKEEAEKQAWENDGLNWTVGREEIDDVFVTPAAIAVPDAKVWQNQPKDENLA